MKAFNDNGQLLDAEFEVERTATGFDVVLHSNGGVSRGKPAYNPDYIPTFEILLVRLADLGASLEGAWVDSKELIDKDLADRRIRLGSTDFPVRLANVPDIGEFRLEIRRSVSKIGRTPGTGNKRIRLALSLQTMPSTADLARFLIGSSEVRRPSPFDQLGLRLVSEQSDSVTITIDEIVELVGELGPEASHPRFWSTLSGRDVTRPQQRAWRNAGYRAELNQVGKYVTFRRVDPDSVTRVTGYWMITTRQEETLNPLELLDMELWQVTSTLGSRLAQGHLLAVSALSKADVGLPPTSAAGRLKGVWILEELSEHHTTEDGTAVKARVRKLIGERRSSGTFKEETHEVSNLELVKMVDSVRWHPITESHFASLLETHGASLDNLPLFVGSPDLLDVKVRANLSQLARDAAPVVRHRMSRYVERGQIGTMMKAANGYRCQICDGLGQSWQAFLKPDGRPYVEAHHVMQVSTLAPDVLGPRNVITVCPNHHRQLHFGGVISQDLGNEFEFTIPSAATVRIRKFGIVD